MIGRFGGFAGRVRCHWIWASPLPTTIATDQAGPLFCGGITAITRFRRDRLARQVATEKAGLVQVQPQLKFG